MLGAFLNLDTKATWGFPILALKSGFKRRVSNFSFIWSFALLCTVDLGNAVSTVDLGRNGYKQERKKDECKPNDNGQCSLEVIEKSLFLNFGYHSEFHKSIHP